MKKSLLYFWRINLAVLLGAALATAVLTGALLVGDSVRGSLRSLTLDRLGKIDHALVADHFFRAGLAEDLSTNLTYSGTFDRATPAIVMTASVVHGSARTRASAINVSGIDQRFLDLFENPQNPIPFTITDLQKADKQVFPSVVINAALQRELNAAVGDQLLIYLERDSEIHRESLFGRKATDDIVRSLRVQIRQIIPDEGIGRFDLRASQGNPLNLFVNLPVLQNALEQEGRVNGLFVSQKSETDDAPALLRNVLNDVKTLDDINLKFLHNADYLTIESTQFILKPEIADVLKTVIAEHEIKSMPMLSYLANEIHYRDRMTPYSTVISFDPALALGNLLDENGEAIRQLADNEVLVNSWMAEDLGLSEGDQIDMVYFDVGLSEELATDTSTFSVAGIVQMKGLGADADLTPDFPGIHDAEDIFDWDPPFDVNLDLIREKDEAYWDDFRATPKAYVSLFAGQQLWKSRFGDLTAIRVAPAAGNVVDRWAQDFEIEVLEEIPAGEAGLIFQPIKEQGLRGAVGATDFSQLFLGFSMFLIVAAALLVGLLFRLGVEQRAPEIGVLLATGYSIKTIRNSFFKEAALIAGIGCLLGLGGAVLYGDLMMRGLSSFWSAATGTSLLKLFINPLSLIIGYVVSLLIVLFSIWRTLRQLRKVPTTALMRGVITNVREKGHRLTRWVAILTALMAIGLLFYAVSLGISTAAPMFFGVGGLLLIAGLTFTASWLRDPARREADTMQLAKPIRMAARNVSRRPGRSLLCIALVACASFMIIAVGANRIDFQQEELNRESGGGGFTLLAETDIPIYRSLNSEQGREELGFSAKASTALENTEIYPLRLLPGEDASCLNLYRPEKPRVIGATEALIQRGGFSFQSLVDGGLDHPWSSIDTTYLDNIVPAIGDANSVMWILHKQLGDTLYIEDEAGRTLGLRLVGLLNTSIFQSELIISEANFLRHFPSLTGDSYFLVETPPGSQDEVTEALESSLGDYGFDAVGVGEKLAAFHAVQNTYLSVFQTLGGLGLLLGTIGFGIVMFRNVVERRGEFATLQAVGFRKRRVSKLLVSENIVLILAGLLLGGIAALIAVAPHLISRPEQVPWISLGATLLVIFLVGVLASRLAATMALRQPLLPALKSDA